MLARPSDFLAAERLLLARAGETSNDRCQAVFEAARRLVPLDAGYLCRIDRAAGTLRFVYNCDGDLYGPGRTLSLGDGPTSRVAKAGRPVVIQDETERSGMVMSPFGEARSSRSAVHWPLRLGAAAAPPDGVLSVQSYRERAYDRETLAGIEWLALRVATFLDEI